MAARSPPPGFYPPRNFKLLDEYDCANGKEQRESLCAPRHAPFINYGLRNEQDDMYLEHWSASIIGPQDKQIGENIYEVIIDVGMEYPIEAPRVKFVRPKVAMRAVDAHGNVDLAKLRPGFRWDRSKSIADALCAIRENMCDNTVCQQSAPLSNQAY